MPELSFHRLRELELEKQMDVLSERQKGWAGRKPVSLSKPPPKKAGRPVWKPDGRTRTLVKCPNCGRTVKAIDGRILSHRRYELKNGYGTGQFCESS